MRIATTVPAGGASALVTRNMTEAEEAEMTALAQSAPETEQTDAERIASLEAQLALLLSGEET